MWHFDDPYALENSDLVNSIAFNSENWINGGLTFPSQSPELSTQQNDGDGQVIFVNGRRTSDPLPPTGGGGEQEDRFLPAEEGGAGNSDQDVVTVSKHPSVGTLTAEQQAAVNKLLNEYIKWLNLLKSLSPNTQIISSDGRSTTAAELLDLWSKTDFVIYPEGHDFRNSGSGSADYNNGDPILGIDIGQLLQNMMNDNSAAWYLTHELAHITTAGQQTNAFMYSPASEGGVSVTEQEWIANETFADLMGGAIAEASGFVWPNDWRSPYGFTPNS